MGNWNTFGAWTSHEQTQTHKTHHSPNLGEATTFPLYSILYAWPWGQHPNVILSRNSQVESSKIPEIGTPTTLEAHNFLCRPLIEMRSQEKF